MADGSIASKCEESICTSRLPFLPGLLPNGHGSRAPCLALIANAQSQDGPHSTHFGAQLAGFEALAYAAKSLLGQQDD